MFCCIKMLVIFYLLKGDTHMILKSFVISSKIKSINTFNYYITYTTLMAIKWDDLLTATSLLVTGYQTPFPSLQVHSLLCNTSLWSKKRSCHSPTISYLHLFHLSKSSFLTISNRKYPQLQPFHLPISPNYSRQLDKHYIC